jgi:hypothetical protein
VRVFPYPARVAWFASHGMPDGTQIDELADQTPEPPESAKVVAVPPQDPAFRPLRQWMVAKGAHVYLLWLLTHPWYVVSEPLIRPERSYNFAQGNLQFYAADQHRMASPLTVIVWPPLIGLLTMAALAIYLGILSEAWRDRPWRAVLILTGLGVLAMLVAWHGDGQEVTRHTIEGLAELRLGLWILIIVGLLGLRLTGEAGDPAAGEESISGSSSGPNPTARPNAGA